MRVRRSLIKIQRRVKVNRAARKALVKGNRRVVDVVIDARIIHRVGRIIRAVVDATATCARKVIARVSDGLAQGDESVVWIDDIVEGRNDRRTFLTRCLIRARADDAGDIDSIKVARARIDVSVGARILHRAMRQAETEVVVREIVESWINGVVKTVTDRRMRRISAEFGGVCRGTGAADYRVSEEVIAHQLDVARHRSDFRSLILSDNRVVKIDGGSGNRVDARSIQRGILRDRHIVKIQFSSRSHIDAAAVSRRLASVDQDALQRRVAAVDRDASAEVRALAVRDNQP